MAIFDKFQQLAMARQELADFGIESINVVMEKILSPTEAVINGRRSILVGTNNNLGLTFDPDCIQAACQAAREQGTGTTGSRMANGSYAGHVELEQELAEFFGMQSTIVFSTGYTANLGMLFTLAGPGDVLLIDSDSHASIYDGSRMSSADIIRFRHNDINDLEKRLQRLGEKAANTVIVVEGIYSMFGDQAPLAEIADLKNEYGAYLLVDEAHSLGVLGEHGRGLGEALGVEDSVDFIVGTFSKSLAGIGGFCVSNHAELDLIRYASRPYIFTASPSPSAIASTRKALEIMGSGSQLRTQLWENANRMYRRLQELGFSLGPQPSPIIAVRLAEKEKAMAIWTGLLERGVYVNLVLPPASPDGGSLLRCSVSAAHTKEQIVTICDAFESLREIL